MLNTGVPLIHARRLEVVGGRIERQRRKRIAACRGQLLQLSPVHASVQHSRGVGDHVKDRVPLRPVVEDPEPTTDDGPSSSGQVVHRADARRDPEGRAGLETVADPVARLEGAVEAIRAGREPADEAFFDGVRQRRCHALGDERRIHPAPHATRTRRPADAHRSKELRRPVSIELFWQEIRGLERRVPLRHHVIEPHAVIEREPARGPPVVLRVPLDVLVAPFRERVLRGLLIEVEHPRGGVRVTEPGVERVTRVVREIDLAVEAREDALRLEAVLKVEAGLRGMGAPDFGDVRDDVVGDVLVGERSAISLILTGIAGAPATEDEIWGVVGLNRVRIQQRHRREAPGRTKQIRLLQLEVQ